jgi:hypothetical protein
MKKGRHIIYGQISLQGAKISSFYRTFFLEDEGKK